MKKVAIVMGSDSDLPVLQKTVDVLKHFQIPFEAHVLSAHRTPDEAADFAKNLEKNGFGVAICAAGMAAHLAGVIAAHTVLPVIGVPIKSSFEGLDALLATVQMPSGVPVACVAVNGGANAGYLAAEMLALSDGVLTKKLKDYKAEMRESVLAKDAAVSSKLE